MPAAGRSPQRFTLFRSALMPTLLSSFKRKSAVNEGASVHREGLTALIALHFLVEAFPPTLLLEQ